MKNKALIDTLHQKRSLTHEEWCRLIGEHDEEDASYAEKLARGIAVAHFGRKIYFRGIVEFSNYCKNDCLYCGIRHANRKAERYRLRKEDVLSCCEDGYSNGFRTFVLQGGEDPFYTDEVLLDTVASIRQTYPDCAITLSLGERSRASYQKLYDAGADRYLLRHETASPALYKKWHPDYQHFENRMRCLQDLKEIGYQTGCGFMVGAPFQTAEDLAVDMEFITDFKPAMVGIGPFVPHSETPFKAQSAGSTNFTLFMLSLCRILHPKVLMPATTALGTVQDNGRQLGVLAGCNVVMPNLSPMSVRKKYMLYNNKAGTGDDAFSGIRKLTAQMEEIGYQVICGRGDYQAEEKRSGND